MQASKNSQNMPEEPAPLNASMKSQGGRDSGFFSQLSQQTQMTQSQGSFTHIPSLQKEVSDIPDLAADTTAEITFASTENDENTRQSFHSANEVLSVKAFSPQPPKEQPKETAPQVVIPMKQQAKLPPRSQTPTRASPSPTKLPRSPFKEKNERVNEPRRSGRLAEAARKSAEGLSIQQEQRAHSPVKPLGSPARLRTPNRTPLTNKNNRANMSPTSPMQYKLPSPLRKSPLKEVIVPKDDSSNSASNSPHSSEASTPLPSLVRKSSIAFASLPVREPLTNKKKSTGGSHVRSSYLEKAAQNGSQRASWMGRATNGKSLGATSRSIIMGETNRQMEDKSERKRSLLDTQELDDEESSDDDGRRKRSRGHTYTVPTKSGDDSDNETRRQVEQHNMSSTRSLHEKIEMLNKHSAMHSLKSLTSTPAPPSEDISAEPSYPTLPRPSKEHAKEAEVGDDDDDDEEDWIPMKKTSTRPELDRATTSTSTQSFTLTEKSLTSTPKATRTFLPRLSPKKVASPERTVQVYTQSSTTYDSFHTATSRPTSPAKSLTYTSNADDSNKDKSLRGSPFKSPAIGLYGLKAATESAFKNARQKLFNNAAVGPSERSDALSPPPPEKDYRDGPETNAMLDEPIKLKSNKLQVSKEPSYPTLSASALEDEGQEPRRTRSSKSREEARAMTPPSPKRDTREEERRREEEEERRREEEQRRKIEEIERARAAREAEEARRREKEELRRQRAEEKRQEEERRRLQREELERERQRQRELEEERIAEQKRVEALREQLRREEEERLELEQRIAEERAIQEELQRKLEAERKADEAKRAAREPPRPLSRLQKPAPRTLRAPKTAIPQKPVSIKTASQRELDNRKPAPQTSASSLNDALKDTFGSSNSQGDLGASQLNSSQSSIRAAAAGVISKGVKALESAAQAKKKQQEDAARKAAQRQEIIRRREENQRRLAREEEERRKGTQSSQGKPRQRTVERELEPVKKKLAPTSTSKPLLSRTTPGPSSSIRKVDDTPSHAPPTGSKRPLQETDEQHRYGTIKAVPSTTAPDAKRPKTDEYENMPVRPSTNKVAHGYAPASTTKTPMAPPSMKPPQTIPTKKNDGGRSLGGKDSGSNRTPSSWKTPVQQAQTQAQQPQTVKSSPHYPPGESIELPPIPSDSEDDYSEDELPSKKSFSRPLWAESPELQAALLQQQTMDPEAIFGPMPALQMDEIFRGGRGGRDRWRGRTSSANWSRDAVTREEVERDLEARRELRERGGWSFNF